MKHFSLALVSLGLVAAPVAAFGQGQAKVDQRVETGDADRVICRTEKTTGSRIGAKRRCMTAAQWAEIKRYDRQAIESVQAQRFKSD